MIAIPFDSLQFAKKLKAAKDPETQAEVVAAAFRENFDEIRENFDERDKELADVKAKLQTLAADAKSNAEKMATKEDVSKLDTKIELLRKDVEASKKDIIIWLGGGLIAAVTIILGAIGLAARYLSQVT